MSTSDFQPLGAQARLRRDWLQPADAGGNGSAIRFAVAVLALVALGVLGSLPADRSEFASQSAGITLPGNAAAPAIAFDGRGKWGGYAR